MADTFRQGQQETEKKSFVLSSEQLASLEYEALRAEERDRMNARLQFWVIYLSLVTAFGLATLQSSVLGYLVALLPLVLACLARYIAHSEAVLKQIRKFLFTVEQRADYQGYEHYSRSVVRSSHGGYGKALRDAFLLTESVAMAIVLVRLWFDHLAFVGILVSIVEAAALAATSVWLCRK